MGLILMVVGFMWWWPLGLIILVALIANGRIGYRHRLQFADQLMRRLCDEYLHPRVDDEMPIVQRVR